MLPTQTRQIVIYAVIATVVFVAIYFFYKQQPGSKAITGDDNDPTGKENVPAETGYEKEKTDE